MLAGFTSNGASAVAVQLTVVELPRSNTSGSVKASLLPAARSVKLNTQGEPGMLAPLRATAVTVTVPVAG